MVKVRLDFLHRHWKGKETRLIKAETSRRENIFRAMHSVKKKFKISYWRIAGDEHQPVEETAKSNDQRCSNIKRWMTDGGEQLVRSSSKLTQGHD